MSFFFWRASVSKSWRYSVTGLRSSWFDWLYTLRKWITQLKPLFLFWTALLFDYRLLFILISTRQPTRQSIRDFCPNLGTSGKTRPNPWKMRFFLFLLNFSLHAKNGVNKSHKNKVQQTQFKSKHTSTK